MRTTDDYLKELSALEDLMSAFANFPVPDRYELRFRTEPVRADVYDKDMFCFVASVSTPEEFEAWLQEQARQDALLEERIRSWDFLVLAKTQNVA